MYNHPVVVSFAIANGAQESDAKRVTAGFAAGLLMPSAFTGTAITFLACDTMDGTYLDVYDSDGNQVSVAVAASRACGLSGAEADALSPYTYLKIKSGSAEAAARTVKLQLR